MRRTPLSNKELDDIARSTNNLISSGALKLLGEGYHLTASDYNWNTGKWEPKEPLTGIASDEALTCTRCRQVKSTEEFHRRPPEYSGGRGYSYYCKDCTRILKSKRA